MSNTFYRPLTPKLRNKINNCIDNNIYELRTCENNAFVNIQITGNTALKNLIKNLPDGYPIPMKGGCR